MMRKEGRVLISQLILIILAIALGILILYGLINRGFDPLFKRVEAQYDSVLILFHIGGNGGGSKGCLRDSGREIPETSVRGDVVVCKDRCEFNLSSPKELLGADKFKMGGNNLEAWFANNQKVIDSEGDMANNKWIDVASWGNDPTDSSEEREAFSGLEEVANEFFNKVGKKGESKKDFFVPMEFNSKGVLEYTVINKFGNSVFAFRWNGKGWRKGDLIYGKDFFISAVDAFEEIYKWYHGGEKVFWNYSGDGKLNAPLLNKGDGKLNHHISNFNENFKDVAYTKGEISEWLYKIRDEFIKSTRSENNLRNWIQIYFTEQKETYSFNRKGWKRDFYMSQNKIISDEEMINKIYEANLKKEKVILSSFFQKASGQFPKGKQSFTPVSNEEIPSSYDFSIGKTDFEKWFDQNEKDWTLKNKAQKKFLTNLDNFLDNSGKGTSVNFGGESSKVETGWVEFDGLHRIPIIYFKLQNGEKFGLYYKNGLPSFVYSGSDEEFKISPINEELRYSDSDWDSFIKINEIYDFFKLRGCGG